jgi:hypothetical protein
MNQILDHTRGRMQCPSLTLPVQSHTLWLLHAEYFKLGQSIFFGVDTLMFLLMVVYTFIFGWMVSRHRGCI